MKILALHNNSGSRFYRIVPQLKHMQSVGHEVLLEPHNTQHLFEKIAWCDVLICQMVFSPEVITKAKQMGKVVIFECDDLIHKTHPQHYAYNETRGLSGAKLYLSLIWNLNKCDGFIGTTRALDDMYGKWANNSLIFPNYMEIEHWLKEPKKNHTDRIRILWGGSTSHTGDLHWVRPIIQEILKRYPQVQFIYVGHGGVPTKDLYARFIYGDDIFEGLPENRRESMLPVPPNVWPYTLASLSADIAIAPLEKLYFNAFKSQCKYLEYAINEIPGVYSKWHYTDVKDGETGVLADTPQEWITKLSILIEDAKLRARIGKQAREEVLKNFTTAQHIHKWQGFVEGLYESFNPTQPGENKKRSEGGRLL